MTVVKVVDPDVADKVDTQYIEAQLAEVHNVGIVYICTSEGGEEDDWTDDSGVHYIVIQLPYQEVRAATDIRPMMLEQAKARLGR